MDSFDLFRKLTTGAMFVKKKNPPNLKTELLQSHTNNTDNQNNKNQNDNLMITNKNEFNSEPKLSDADPFPILTDFQQIQGKSKKRKHVEKGDIKKKIKTEFEFEEVNRLRNKYRIKVYGKNFPSPIQTFDELENDYKVSNEIISSLTSCGYESPTPIQMQAIPIMLHGHSLLACAPTGSGKTVAFLLPIINDIKNTPKSGIRAIILCPTMELAKQIQRDFLRLTENFGLKCYNKKNQKCDIIISTPKRICYLLNQEQSPLDLKNIKWFIIDEADKLMEEGKNCFKDQLDQIISACTNSSKKFALFSATYTVSVSKWSLRNVKDLKRVVIGEFNSATDTIEQELLFVGSESGKLLAFRELVRNGLQPPVLVFVQTKDRAKQLFQELIYDGINVDVIHSDRTQLQRDNVVKAFREGKIWILICTELMSRGIDFKGVNLVINYDFPPTTISYIHRIGRAGRAGRLGKSITYFTQDDKIYLKSIAHIIKNSGGSVPDFMLKLKKLKKSEKKLFAKKPLDRNDISTTHKFNHKKCESAKSPGLFVKLRK